MESSSADSNSLRNAGSVLQDHETSGSAAGDQFAYKDVPQGLLEAEERRRQSFENSEGSIGSDLQGCFEKPAPLIHTGPQGASKSYIAHEKEANDEGATFLNVEKDGSIDNHSNQRFKSVMQENKVLKCEVETYKLKVASMLEENKHLRQDAVDIQAKAEQEEEFISNTLLKKIQALKKEKENLAINYEQEEEYLTNDLTRKLEQLRQEKIQLEHTLEHEQECLVNKLMRRIDKLESETTAKQSSLETLRREKVELENTLEQEQEALVNKLWKRMDHLETEKRALQAKLEKPVSEKGVPPVDEYIHGAYNIGDGTTDNMRNDIRSLKKDCTRLKKQLITGKEEHEKKMVEYAKEEKEIKDENLRLQRRLQIEMERREALCRQLSESESSIEMDEPGLTYNELWYGPGSSSISSIGSITPATVSSNRTRSISSELTGSMNETANMIPLSSSFNCGEKEKIPSKFIASNFVHSQDAVTTCFAQPSSSSKILPVAASPSPSPPLSYPLLASHFSSENPNIGPTTHYTASHKLPATFVRPGVGVHLPRKVVPAATVRTGSCNSNVSSAAKSGSNSLSDTSRSSLSLMETSDDETCKSPKPDRKYDTGTETVIRAPTPTLSPLNIGSGPSKDVEHSKQ